MPTLTFRSKKMFRFNKAKKKEKRKFNISILYMCRGTRGIIVIDYGNGHGDMSSNPGQS